jgi:hypothetical protein
MCFVPFPECGYVRGSLLDVITFSSPRWRVFSLNTEAKCSRGFRRMTPRDTQFIDRTIILILYVTGLTMLTHVRLFINTPALNY